MVTKAVLALVLSITGLCAEFVGGQSKHPQTISKTGLIVLAGILPTCGFFVLYGPTWQFVEQLINLALGLSIALCIVEVFKYSIVSVRPYAVGYVDTNPDARRSFPSAHAALAIAGIMPLVADVWPPWTDILEIIVVFICVSRVTDKMHHVIDVIVGACIGYISILLSKL